LLTMGVTHGVEISSMADIPAGTGLGSSGAFTVGLLKALYAHTHRLASNEELAELACHIEIDLLGEPVGKQDQYAAAIGGITAFDYQSDDTVLITPVSMPVDARNRFEDGLVLFYTGIRRSASEELTTQVGAVLTGRAVEDNLRKVRDLGRCSFDALREGDLENFARLLTEQWELKYERSSSATHAQVDAWIREGIAAGALGGKLVGAGGGGFLLFYADAKVQLRHRMADLGLEEVRFGFDYEGAKTLVS
jgi:D-glycero-alpha-D-manno-heptose-7-phosphate kinase